MKFLVKKSEKSFKDMLKIAKDYDLEAIRDHCLMKLDTKEKILSVASFLLKKSTTL